MEATEVASMAGGSAVVIFVVMAVRSAFSLQSKVLPLLSLIIGVAWSMGSYMAGVGVDNPFTAVVTGIMTAATASGAQGWVQTYRAPSA